MSAPPNDIAPIDTAMVLAAGLGKRMRPLSNTTPKPLIPVAGKALIDYALDRFVAADVRQTIVNVHYLADQVEAHLALRDAPAIIVSDERDELLETGGGIKHALPLLGPDPIFCTNTDAILIDGQGTEPCQRLIDAWDPTLMDALLLLVPTEKTSGYEGHGDFARDRDGRISFRDGGTAPYVFTGLQIINPAFSADGPEGPFSTKLLWDQFLAAKRLYGVVHDGDWLHVGDPDGLALAERFFGQLR